MSVDLFLTFELAIRLTLYSPPDCPALAILRDGMGVFTHYITDIKITGLITVINALGILKAYLCCIEEISLLGSNSVLLSDSTENFYPVPTVNTSCAYLIEGSTSRRLIIDKQDKSANMEFGAPELEKWTMVTLKKEHYVGKWLISYLELNNCTLQLLHIITFTPRRAIWPYDKHRKR